MAQAAGPYEVVVSKDVMISMRDGLKLATDVYLPARNGVAISEKLPAVMLRGPYNKGGQGNLAAANFFASHGYAVVVQDVRGRFKSEGVWRRFYDDPNDTLDTGNWLERQPWSNGKFGMTGCSYVGGTQHVAALTQPPVKQLATVIPEDATSNMGLAEMRNNGAFELRMFNWIFTNGPASAGVREPGLKGVLDEMTENRLKYLAMLPIRPGTTPLKLIPEYEEWLIEAMKAGRANDDFWRMNRIRDEYGPYSEADKYKDMPIYMVGGWYDSKPAHTTGNYSALTKRVKGPVYLIMGPWIHCNRADHHGQVSFGKDAEIDQKQYNLSWFDRWLKGQQGKFDKEVPFRTKVRIFVMGTGDERKDSQGLKNHGGYWRDEDEWPLARTQYTNFYFQEGGGLSTGPPAAAESSTSFVFDPRNPVPTIGGNVSSAQGIMLQGAWDQRGGKHVWNWQDPVPLSARNDVLVFQTAPLTTDVEVTGELTVKFWAASSAVDTDYTVKLVDVHPANPDFPGGFDQNITDAILRARFRESLFEEKLMEPGKVSLFTFKLYPTSNVFKRGHRIRVDISSSNFPRFDVNPNTGEPIGENRRWEIATNTLYHDKDHPSHIVLPVIPLESTNGRK